MEKKKTKFRNLLIKNRCRPMKFLFFGSGMRVCARINKCVFLFFQIYFFFSFILALLWHFFFVLGIKISMAANDFGLNNLKLTTVIPMPYTELINFVRSLEPEKRERGKEKKESIPFLTVAKWTLAVLYCGCNSYLSGNFLLLILVSIW